MINFIIPGLYELNKLNINLLYLLKYRPEFFENNIKIGAVFGAFHFNIWDGGRIFHSYKQASREDIQNLKKLYNDEFQVPMRFVFTNNLLTLEDCYDKFNNMVLEICHNDLNEIVLTSPILYDYIKENYPKYKIISSTTKCITNSEESLQEILDDKYYMTCIDYNLNHNWNLLNIIPEDKKDKVEFLVNAICPSGCQFRKEHYKLNSVFSLNYGKLYPLPGCNIKFNTLEFTNERNNNITKEEIFNQYAPKGFTNFKIEGRTLSDYEVGLNYVRYMVKDEYKELVALYLIKDTEELLYKLGV